MRGCKAALPASTPPPGGGTPLGVIRLRGDSRLSGHSRRTALDTGRVRGETGRLSGGSDGSGRTPGCNPVLEKATLRGDTAALSGGNERLGSRPTLDAARLRGDTAALSICDDRSGRIPTLDTAVPWGDTTALCGGGDRLGRSLTPRGDRAALSGSGERPSRTQSLDAATLRGDRTPLSSGREKLSHGVMVDAARLRGEIVEVSRSSPGGTAPRSETLGPVAADRLLTCGWLSRGENNELNESRSFEYGTEPEAKELSNPPFVTKLRVDLSSFHS